MYIHYGMDLFVPHILKNGTVGHSAVKVTF